MEIVPLSCHPEFAEICAAWSYGQWGCHIEGLNLGQVIEGYKQRASEDSLLPKTWVVIDGGKNCVGMVSLKDKELDNYPQYSPWVGSLYVHSNSRGIGLGTKLMGNVESEARKRGYKGLYLFTSDAEKFYMDRLEGWSIIERFPDPIKPSKLVPLLKKDLN